jgi:CBS domain-containing protein
MNALRGILDGKGRTLTAIGPNHSVHDAVDRMCRAHVGAVLVLDEGLLAGILSERDVMRRVVLEHLDPTQTRVRDVMTHEVICIDPDMDPMAAMSLMTTRRCRHLPVVERDRVIGILSIGDLVRWASMNQESELQALTEYVAGAYVHVS